MNASFFVGREDEQQALLELLTSKRAELVTVIGRRRIGKTFLIKNAYNNQFDFYMTGIRDADKPTLIKAFLKKIQEYAKSKSLSKMPDNWMDVFELLKKYLKSIKHRKKRIIFFDEFPWLDNQKSGFLSAFEYFWNDWAVDQNIVVILCGSSTSWMLKNIVNNRGGLHNRITKYIPLAPFTLKETKLFLEKRNIKLPHYEIIQLYMALGGVPYYLHEVKKGESAIQSIDRILFSPKSTLKNEFQNLYRALFDHYEKYELIVKALSTKQKGLTRLEIIEATGISNGGGLTRMLKELEECSFVKTMQPFGKSKKELLYRLVDEYSVFYFQFHPSKKPAGSFMQISASNSYKSWAGFAFESLCMKHILEIKKALGINGIFSTESSFFLKGNAKTPGFQIDMLIDRNDNAINICEMKFHKTEYELRKKEADELRKRRELFRAKSKTRKHLIYTLISTYGIKHNEYSTGIIDKSINTADLFL